MRRRATLALAAIAALILAAPASAEQHTAASGQVSATFSYDPAGAYQYWDLWLTVDRVGVTVFDESLDISSCEEPYCMPGGEFADDGGVKVRDLDADGEPEVIADVFTGGAHCCVASEILRWTTNIESDRPREDTPSSSQPR